ncbi:ECSIT signaling integrator [Chelydra serpentina]|uniref:ECSIT signaling integrator n=1 Tax=Chelydra serpentina TaxID=8475 RepID=A0A8T1RXA2_CHESE|nr:ECSIT signaling integrator [Chelydra serpentina]
MNCVRKLLLARELSAGRSILRQAAPGRDLPWLRGSSCAQRFWPVSVRSIRSSAALSRSELIPSARGDKEKDRGSRDGSLVPFDELFERAREGDRTKAAFSRAVELFCQRDIRRRGHVEFIKAALRKMPEFGVERELDVYNKILDVFPKEVFVPRNFIQRMFNHYPRQQECGIHVLEQMENYGIMPDKQTKFLLLQIFGKKSHPVRKYQRLMYWWRPGHFGQVDFGPAANQSHFESDAGCVPPQAGAPRAPGGLGLGERRGGDPAKLAREARALNLSPFHRLPWQLFSTLPIEQMGQRESASAATGA